MNIFRPCKWGLTTAQPQIGYNEVIRAIDYNSLTREAELIRTQGGLTCVIKDRVYRVKNVPKEVLDRL